MMRRIRGVSKYLLILVCASLSLSGEAQVFDIVVDKNGTGHYTNIQDALDAVPDNTSKRTLIFVKEGLYLEKVVAASTKKNVSLIGENADKVIISWDDFQGKDGISGADSYTFLADAAGFYAENITIQNTAGNVGQAVALRTTGDTMVFKNCRMLGFQDTYYAHKRRQYNLNCTIEGATDFIYGDATTVFDSCTINCVKGGQYITAPADAKLITPFASGDFYHGLLFRYCNVTRDADVGDKQYYLGRPWQPRSSSVYIECTLGPHIKSEGWSTWEGDNHESSVFAEYQNVNNDGSLVDISKRVSWSIQLDSTIAAWRYLNLDFFLRKNFVVWDAKRLTKALAPPTGLSRTGNSLSWELVENAIGYVVLENDAFVGFAKTESFDIPETVDESAEYSVKSVSFSGALSLNSSGVETAVNKIRNNSSIDIRKINEQVLFSQDVSFKIFTLNGKLVKMGKGKSTSLIGINKGFYVIKATAKNGGTSVKKIVI